MKKLLIISFICISHLFSLEMVTRVSDEDGFQIPAGSHFGFSGPKINDRGDIAIRVILVGQRDNETAGVWARDHRSNIGGMVYHAPSGKFLSDLHLSKEGKISFDQFQTMSTDGIFQTGADRSGAVRVKKAPTEVVAYEFPHQTKRSLIYRKRTFDGGLSLEKFFDGKEKTLYSTASDDSNVSYLFRHAVNESGVIALKVRMGESPSDDKSPDQLWLIGADGKKVVIASDVDDFPSSFFAGFDNGVAISESGGVAFIAQVSDKKRGVFFYRDGIVKKVALEGERDLSTIDFYIPSVNDKGLVAFRGKTKDGKSAIFAGNWDGFSLVIKSGDQLPSDIDGTVVLSSEIGPSFISSPSINNSGKLVFHSGIGKVDDNTVVGSGVFLLDLESP